MIQDVFLEVCQLLRDNGGPVYSGEAKHLVDLHEFYLNGKVFESDIQRQEVYTALTTVGLCSLARAALYGDLKWFSGGPESDLTHFFYTHQASAELYRHLDDEMPNGDITVEIVERLDGDAWQRVNTALRTPKALSWMRARHHVNAALSDPVVTGNTEAVAFFSRMDELLHEATANMVLTDILKPLHSSFAKQARDKRTEDTTAKVKAKALAMYDVGSWSSIAQAAKEIYPDLRKYADSIPNVKYLREERFQKTLGEWLRERKKQTASS